VTIRHLLLLLACGSVGLLLDGHGLASWADGLPDWLGPVRDAAHWWDATTTQLGLAVAYDALHRWVRALIAAPF
jgi:hypothetical protein